MERATRIELAFLAGEPGSQLSYSDAKWPSWNVDPLDFLHGPRGDVHKFVAFSNPQKPFEDVVLDDAALQVRAKGQRVPNSIKTSRFRTRFASSTRIVVVHFVDETNPGLRTTSRHGSPAAPLQLRTNARSVLESVGAWARGHPVDRPGAGTQRPRDRLGQATGPRRPRVFSFRKESGQIERILEQD